MGWKERVLHRKHSNFRASHARAPSRTLARTHLDDGHVAHGDAAQLLGDVGLDLVELLLDLFARLARFGVGV